MVKDLIDINSEENQIEEDVLDQSMFEDFNGINRLYVKPKTEEPKKKNVAKSFLNIFDRVTIGVEKADSKLNVGDRVKITNGPFTDYVLIISAFIVGGIQGQIKTGKIINIRHGSYETETSF